MHRGSLPRVIPQEEADDREQRSVSANLTEQDVGYQ